MPWPKSQNVLGVTEAPGRFWQNARYISAAGHHEATAVHQAYRRCRSRVAAFNTRAQQSSSKIPVVGILWHAASADEEEVYLSVLVKAFNDLGYVEGKNIHLENRFPAENPDRFQTMAQEWST
jgi:hypothetical protein